MIMKDQLDATRTTLRDTYQLPRDTDQFADLLAKLDQSLIDAAAKVTPRA